MKTRTNEMQVARESHRLIAGLLAAIGSVWTSRNNSRTKGKKVQVVSWAGRANTDSWFLFELQQKRDQSLYYYTHNQVR